MRLLDLINEQTIPNLTATEQTLLGFLSRLLRGEKDEFKNTNMDELKKSLQFNEKTINPIVQSLIEKKKTGKKTYDVNTFNALLNTMNKFVPKDQAYEFYKYGGTIDKIDYTTQY